jgi:simple sugar transport system substrate-binding protein
MQQYTIATIGKIAPHPWFDRMEEGVKKFGAATGHTTIFRCPPRIDEMLEERILKEAFDQGVDAVCVVAFFPHALEMTLSKARAKGTVVITHEAPNQRNTDYDIEAFDYFAYGSHLMDILAEYTEHHGKYAILLESLITQSHNLWAQGAIQRQRRKYPGMALVSKKIEHHEDEAIAYGATRRLLDTYPNLRGILGLGVASIPGAARALNERNLTGKVTLIGNSLVSVGKKFLQEGSAQLISFWDPADAGYVMNALAAMVLRGETPTDGMDLEVPGYNRITIDGKVLYGSAWIDVTRKNIAQYNF